MCLRLWAPGSLVAMWCNNNGRTGCHLKRRASATPLLLRACVSVDFGLQWYHKMSTFSVGTKVVGNLLQ